MVNGMKNMMNSCESLQINSYNLPRKIIVKIDI